jgi:hypothetical protein
MATNTLQHDTCDLCNTTFTTEWRNGIPVSEVHNVRRFQVSLVMSQRGEIKGCYYYEKEGGHDQEFDICDECMRLLAKRPSRKIREIDLIALLKDLVAKHREN